MSARHAAFPTRQAHGLPTARPAPACISLIVRVDPRHVFLAHRHLRQYAACPLQVRRLADPDRHGQASFLVRLPHRDADALMHYLMTHLPAAEFGRLASRPLATAAP